MMWAGVVLVCAATIFSGRAAPPSDQPGPHTLGLDQRMVSDLLEKLEELPEDERTVTALSPELMSLYQDVNLLFEMQKSNLSESREGRGLLSKLSFLTGLKLGGFLTSSGTLAASQSINFLGKVLNAALSVSYGSIDDGGYVGNLVDPASDGTIQQLPIIQEDVPLDEKQREKPDTPQISLPNSTNKLDTVGALRKEFIKTHNQRVANFNNSFEKKQKSRTGRIAEINSDQIT